MPTIALPFLASPLVADLAGALIWPAERLVVVADLHFEKGSAAARRGALLPPYDTRSTLAKLADVLRRWSPDRVISLGDGFHDTEASRRLSDEDRHCLQSLTERYPWIWITGNHDPLPPDDVGGEVADLVEIAGLVFRHEPSAEPMRGEVAGHLHPKASVVARGRRVSRPCFVADETRVLLPAFGSYTGGLQLTDPAIASLFPEDYRAYLLGKDKVHKMAKYQIERDRR